MDADKPKTKPNVLWTDLASDDVQRLVGELFGLFDAGPWGRAHTNCKLSGVDDREDCSAEGASDKDGDQAGDRKIAWHDDRSPPYNAS